MAIITVGTNLNFWGDNGRFESDPSTWLGASPTYLNILLISTPSITRSAVYKHAGIYSGKFFAPGLSEGGNIHLIVKGKPVTSLNPAKKYYAKARLRTDVAEQVAPDNVKIVWDKSAFPGGTVFDDETELEIGDIKAGFQEIELYFSNASGQPIIALQFDLDGGAYYDPFVVTHPKSLYIDSFEIYEYIDDSIPDPDPEDPEFETVFFSKNPVPFPKSASVGWGSEENYRLYDAVKVEDTPGSGIFNTKLRQHLYPDSLGNVVFNARAAFRDLLSATPPAYNETEIIRLTDRIKFFKHETGEVTEDDVVPAELEESSAMLVLLGGISKQHHPTLNYFTEYLPTNKKFLTWSPLIKYVDRNQEDYLNFWIYNSDIATLQLQVKSYFDDGTNETDIIKTKEAVVYGQLYQIPAGPSNCGALLINPAKTVVYYELCLLDQDDEVISEVRTFRVNVVTHPRTRFFMFLNSLGSYETLLFTGASEKSTDFDREIVQRFLPYNYNPEDGEFEVNSSTFQQKGTYGSGYIKGALAKQWKEYMIDFMKSSRIFDVTSGDRLKRIITTANLPGEADQEYLRFVRFEAIDNFVDENFTPGQI